MRSDELAYQKRESETRKFPVFLDVSFFPSDWPIDRACCYIYLQVDEWIFLRIPEVQSKFFNTT